MQVLKICLSSKSWSTRGLQVKCTQSKLSKCTAISFHSILKTTPVHKLSKSWSIEVLQVKCTPSKLSKCTPRKLSNWTGVEINSEYVPVTKELGKLFLFHSEYVPVTKELGKLFLFHYEYMFLTQELAIRRPINLVMHAKLKNHHHLVHTPVQITHDN